ncbi:efflux RND transporter periplasmic adaptor subunit [Rhizobium sp. Leaf371]|uniref:efflux RND transporter periplasmic adaptor subunit n=1 Tax=Rhizobium sp. Leaf371 TaxID=1736355 RepID=UPI000B1D1F3F|nr:efflux RND transporter periplasmic adaptor subunit [Rhizobium sp. Leaf371]
MTFSFARMALAATLAVTSLTACSDEEVPPPKPLPRVRVETVAPKPSVTEISLTGSIAARTETHLSFRTSGRIIERLVDVGDAVRRGQLLAQMDDEVQQADLESARATLLAATADLSHATAAFTRQQTLLRANSTAQTTYDLAEENLKVARASVKSAESALSNAEETLSYTKLTADADGVVTARNADVGETVQAAQAVFSVAVDGPRDAVFDIYESLLRSGEPPEVTVSLASDPSVAARGPVREIAPTVDRQTGTVRVKVGLDRPPAAMTLASVVRGTVSLAGPPAFTLPPSALAASGGKPAVWVLDPAKTTVSLRPVTVAEYQTDAMIIATGLKAGDRVVVDGTKLLRQGQTVLLAEGNAP